MRRYLLLSLLLIGTCLGQQGPSSDTLTLVAAPPAPAMSVSVRVNGTIGSDTRYYWVVVRLPIGRIPPYGPAVAFQINYIAGGTVTINWNGVSGATGYDVIRTTDTSFPGQGSCSNCLLASNVTTLQATDTGASLSSYSLTTVAAVTMNAVLNNRDFATPRWIVPVPFFLTGNPALIFPDGTIQNTANTSAGSVTHTLGPLTAGQLIQGNGLGDITVGDLIGDIRTSGTLTTTLQSGVVNILNLNAAILSGNGGKLCTLTGSTTSTRIVIFDASGNCVQSLATLDGSGNFVTPGSSTTGSGGATAGASLWGVQAGLPSLPAMSGFAGFGVNTGAIATTYVLDLPVAGPTLSNSVMVFPSSPTASHYQGTFVQALVSPQGHEFGCTFNGNGSAIPNGSTCYVTTDMPFACTIAGFTIGSTTAETVTFKTWRVNGGTALPVIGNSISTSGVSLTVGTQVQSSTVTDWGANTAIAVHDSIAFNITAITASQLVTIGVRCNQ